LGVGSLILIPLKDFPVALLAFFWGVGMTAAFRLPARVSDALALAPADGSLADSPLGDWAEIGLLKKGCPIRTKGWGK
jgi:hypothetical protein